MRGVGPIAAVLLAIPVALAAETIDTTGRPAIVVRTLNYFNVSRSHLQGARIQAEAILRDAGIDVSWLDCPVDGKAKQGPPECSQAMLSNDLMMRINAAGRGPGAPHVSMGFSLVTLVDGQAPYLATVYGDLVAGIAREAGINTPELLGRVMAHEIGHLLLDTNQHAATGLMRAVWSNAELRHRNVSDWRFSEIEAAILRSSTAARQPDSRPLNATKDQRPTTNDEH